MTTISPTKALVDSDREFWHGVLTGGGFTPIPRWTLDPVPGVAVCEAAVPRDLLPALRQRAAEVGVPLSSVLLAAHATVLAALSGESEVVTGYLAGIRGVPERAAITVACAASSTELSGTPTSAARCRSAGSRSRGTAASQTATPGTGSTVHRGIGVNPPPVSTPCQNSRSESARALAGLIVVMSHLPRGVSPHRAAAGFLALHQE